MNLSSGLPYDAEVYAVLMADYNRRWFLVILLMSALALATIWLAWIDHAAAPRIVGLVLAIMAGWVGIAHQSMMMSEVNFAASAYAAGWLVFSGWLVIRLALVPPAPREDHGALRLGVSIMAAALFLYPALQALTGVAPHGLDFVGMAPNATALFAAGAVLAVAPSRRFDLLIIPALWSGVAGLHGALLGLSADYLIPALLFACVVAYATAQKSPAA